MSMKSPTLQSAIFLDDFFGYQELHIVNISQHEEENTQATPETEKIKLKSSLATLPRLANTTLIDKC